MPCECDCVYFWSWYYMWTIRSTVLKIGSLLLFLAFILEVVALVTGFWLHGPDGYTGLFDVTIKSSLGEPTPVPILCPILAVLSAIILFCDNILNLLFVTRRFHLVMPAVIVFSFIGAMMLMTVIVTWSVPDVTMGQRLSWSFVLATIAVVVDMAGCGLCVMEFLSRRELPMNRNSARHLDLELETVTDTSPLEPDSDSGGGDGGGGGRGRETERATHAVDDVELQEL